MATANPSRMIAQERHQRILEDIEMSGIVTVRDLVRRLNVSSITVTRDLQAMEEQGLLRRVHGGAVSARSTVSYEPPLTIRETQQAGEKQRIGIKAAELVEEGDSILLDVGTTALAVARALKGKRNLTVLVTNLRAALELADEAAMQIIVIGGKLRANELSMVGRLTEQTLEAFHVDLAFIGIGGISLENGLTEYDLQEAGTKQAMIKRAPRRIIVADHTKFGRTMLNVVAPLDQVDTIITGNEVDATIVDRLQRAGIQVILV